jgi:osmoprotectant transport system permease protein
MNEPSFLAFISDRLPELLEKTTEHLILTGLSTSIAILCGLPLGILIAKISRFRGPVLGITGIIQTVPSLAMLAFLLPLLGIGTTPAIVALSLYALLPIVRNTYTGLINIQPEIVEAAKGLGFSGGQQLWLVEMPLALPVIFAGIRTAAVIGVGIATLSSFIGAGGLGDFINRGLALNNTRLILLGAISAAALALMIEFLLAAFEKFFWRQKTFTE